MHSRPRSLSLVAALFIALGVASFLRTCFLLWQGVVGFDLLALGLPLGIGLIRYSDWCRKAGILFAFIFGGIHAFTLVGGIGAMTWVAAKYPGVRVKFHP